MTRCYKNTYPSKEAAAKIGKQVVKAGRAKQNRAYYCQRCQGWHLTSQALRDYLMEGRL